MTVRWRPSAQEERWLALAAELGAAAVSAERTGGWRSTGLLARMSLFVLGIIAGALLVGLLGFGDEITLLLAGVIATLVAEWLVLTRRLFASGIEEGLCVAGFLLIAAWITTLIAPPSGYGSGLIATLVLIAAAGAAGMRLLNPLVTTCAMIGLVYWAGSTETARAIDQSVGRGMTSLVAGCSLAALALVTGSHEFRRPSYDRMLDWAVVLLPLAAYVQFVTWNRYGTEGAIVAGASRSPMVLLLVALAGAMLFVGVHRRRHPPLLGAMACVACVAVEMRLAFPWIPTEAWLVGGGVAALILGIALDKSLKEPRNGFTSAALPSGDGPLDLVETVGAAALTQRSAPDAQHADATVTGGGGRFGGGGASGSF